MLTSILKKLYWILVGRSLMKKKCKGFVASMVTYVAPDCEFSGYNTLYSKTSLFNTKLGAFTYVNGAQITNAIVGTFSSIGPNVKIGGFGRHPTNWISTHPAFFSTKQQTQIYFADKDYFEEFLPVNIGNDVWIGANALVLDGVHVSDGAIIAAGSVVTKDVKPYEIVGGVPAKHIRYRFSEEIIQAIRNNPWWEKDIAFLAENSELFRSDNAEKLINKLSETRHI